MRKTTVFAVFFITFLSLLTLTACGSKQAVDNGNRNAFRRPDFGQPEKQADVSGLVKSIIGNEVTILKMERSQRGEESDSEAGDDEEGEGQQGNLNMTFNGAGGQRMVIRGGGRPGGEWDEDSRAAMLERMKEMSSGEEIITIPVGIQMLKSDITGGSDEPEMIEATLADITADKMIQVWLDESVSDRKIASFVLIMR